MSKVAIFDTETPPADVLTDRCPDYAGKPRWMDCDRPKGHEGRHWSSDDARFWTFGPSTDEVEDDPEPFNGIPA